MANRPIERARNIGFTVAATLASFMGAEAVGAIVHSPDAAAAVAKDTSDKPPLPIVTTNKPPKTGTGHHNPPHTNHGHGKPKPKTAKNGGNKANSSVNYNSLKPISNEAMSNNIAINEAVRNALGLAPGYLNIETGSVDPKNPLDLTDNIDYQNKAMSDVIASMDVAVERDATGDSSRPSLYAYDKQALQNGHFKGQILPAKVGGNNVLWFETPAAPAGSPPTTSALAKVGNYDIAIFADTPAHAETVAEAIAENGFVQK